MGWHLPQPDWQKQQSEPAHEGCGADQVGGRMRLASNLLQPF